MNEEVIIEYTRTKTELTKILFRRFWLKQVGMYFFFRIVLIPAWIMLGMAFGIQFDNFLGFEDKTSGIFSFLMVLILLYFSFSPVIKLYNNYKNQIKITFGSNSITHHKLYITEDKFKDENEHFWIEAPWSNTTLMLKDQQYLIFQMRAPNIAFLIPVEKISDDVMSLLLTKILKK